jgi:hypothetical protein
MSTDAMLEGMAEMAQPTLWERFKYWIGGIGFGVFLWSIGQTAEQYLTTISHEAIHGYFYETNQEPPPERYWQHDETGRVCATVLQPSERWDEITREQYSAAVGAMGF